ncbi:hypothetical protein EDC04DRAFT_2602538 [Pisolithus marmoratus]|nr:hypothetical protein EDC04DRAFT_2602538 [Pisolithus marmoratus]
MAVGIFWSEADLWVWKILFTCYSICSLGGLARVVLTVQWRYSNVILSYVLDCASAEAKKEWSNRERGCLGDDVIRQYAEAVRPLLTIEKSTSGTFTCSEVVALTSPVQTL